MPRRIPSPLVAGVAGVLLLAGCSKPASHAFTTQATTTVAPAPATTVATPSTTAAPAPVPTPPITLSGAGFDVHTAGRVSQAEFDATWAGVMETLNRWLETAVLQPLRSGGPAGDLAPLFSPLTADRVTSGPDRAAFIDEGMPAAADLRSERARATLTALAGADGKMSVVTAQLDLRLIGHVNGAPLRVVRSGELVLMPEGGSWRIDAYDLRVTRSMAEATTTTTVRS